MRNFIRDWHADVSERLPDATAAIGFAVLVGLALVLTHPLGVWLLNESMGGAR
ncbi:MAG: hypothetical protein ACXVGF_04555 [Blastococcus sp.]